MASRFRRHLREYWSFLLTLLQDLRPWRRTIVLASLGLLTGMIGQLVGFAVVYKYLALLRSDAELGLGGLHLGRASDLSIFLAVASLGAGAMLGAAFADYRGKVAVIDVGEAYWLFGDNRLRALCASLGLGRAHLLDQATLQNLFQQSRHASTACRQLTAALSNVAAFPLGLLLLLRLDIELTLAVCAVFVPGALVLYRASLDVAAARSSELLHTGTMQAQMRERRRLGETPSDQAPDEMSKTTEDAHDASTSRDLRMAQRRQQIVAQRGTLVSQLVTATCVLVVFVIGGERAVSTGNGWGELVIFLLVLRLVGGRLTALVRAPIALSRLYPGLRRYFSILDAMRDASSTPGDPAVAGAHPASPVKPSPRTTVELTLAGGRPTRLQGGELVGLWCAAPEIRSLEEQLRKAAREQDDSEGDWPCRVSAPSTIPAGELGEILGMSSDAERIAFRNRVVSAGFPRGLAALAIQGGDAGVVEKTPEKVFLLMVLVETFRLLDSGAGTLIYRLKDLKPLSWGSRRLLLRLGQSAGRLVLVQFDKPSRVGGLPLERVLLSDGNSVVGESSLTECAGKRAPAWTFQPSSQLNALDHLLRLLR